MTQTEKDGIEMQFMAPANEHASRLMRECGIDNGDKLAAYSRLAAYLFAEGVRTALAYGPEASRSFVEIQNEHERAVRLDPSTLKAHMRFDGVPNPLPWEVR